MRLQTRQAPAKRLGPCSFPRRNEWVGSGADRLRVVLVVIGGALADAAAAVVVVRAEAAVVEVLAVDPDQLVVAVVLL